MKFYARSCSARSHTRSPSIPAHRVLSAPALLRVPCLLWNPQSLESAPDFRSPRCSTSTPPTRSTCPPNARAQHPPARSLSFCDFD